MNAAGGSRSAELSDGGSVNHEELEQVAASPCSSIFNDPLSVAAVPRSEVDWRFRNYLLNGCNLWMGGQRT